jgi:hypothetical protein
MPWKKLKHTQKMESDAHESHSLHFATACCVCSFFSALVTRKKLFIFNTAHFFLSQMTDTNYYIVYAV